MNCQQVNKLSFHYCDKELQPHLITEFEQHLETCPECRRLSDFTRLALEALTFDGDILELDHEFTSKVMRSIGYYTTENKISAGFWARWKSYKKKANLLTALAGAAIILALALTPEMKSYLDNVYVPNAVNITQQDSVNSPDQTSAPEDAGSNYDITAGSANKLLSPGVYNTDVLLSQRSRNGNEPLARESETQNSLVYFSPSYLPDGFSLARIENDAGNNISLYYEDTQGRLITFKVMPVALDAASKTEDDVQIMAGAPKNKSAAPSEGAVSGSMINSKTWVVNSGDATYVLQILGSISSDEIEKMSASVEQKGGP